MENATTWTDNIRRLRSTKLPEALNILGIVLSPGEVGAPFGRSAFVSAELLCCDGQLLNDLSLEGLRDPTDAVLDADHQHRMQRRKAWAGEGSPHTTGNQNGLALQAVCEDRIKELGHGFSRIDGDGAIWLDFKNSVGSNQANSPNAVEGRSRMACAWRTWAPICIHIACDMKRSWPQTTNGFLIPDWNLGLHWWHLLSDNNLQVVRVVVKPWPRLWFDCHEGGASLFFCLISRCHTNRSIHSDKISIRSLHICYSTTRGAWSRQDARAADAQPRSLRRTNQAEIPPVGRSFCNHWIGCHSGRKHQSAGTVGHGIHRYGDFDSLHQTRCL